MWIDVCKVYLNPWSWWPICICLLPRQRLTWSLLRNLAHERHHANARGKLLSWPHYAGFRLPHCLVQRDSPNQNRNLITPTGSPVSRVSEDPDLLVAEATLSQTHKYSSWCLLGTSTPIASPPSLSLSRRGRLFGTSPPQTPRQHMQDVCSHPARLGNKNLKIKQADQFPIDLCSVKVCKPVTWFTLKYGDHSLELTKQPFFRCSLRFNWSLSLKI